MGKKLYTKENISKAETEWLGIPELVVLKTNSDDVGLEVVHRRYFEDEKLLCPACRSSKTRCSKIVDRKLKDLLWLDEDHKTFQIKALFAFGKGLPITKENLVDEGIPVISYGQIHAKYNTGTSITESLFRYVPESYIESNPDSLVHKGDILVADTSEDIDGCGNSVYIDKEMPLFAGYHTIILKSINQDDNKYLAYLFKSHVWRSQIRTRVSGVKLFSISKKILNFTTVILPPKEEQEEITRFLDEKCKLIDTLIENKQALRIDLETYKRSLIYESVTGKRKVV